MTLSEGSGQPDWTQQMGDWVARLDHEPDAVAHEVAAVLALATDVDAVVNLSALLIDAGAISGDRLLVNKAVAALEALDDPPPEAIYNLANGLIARCDLTGPEHEDFDLTREQQHRARQLFAQASRHPDLSAFASSQASTNLGNQLSKYHRFVEAYDAFRLGLVTDPTNGVAAMNAARELQHAITNGLSGPRGPAVYNELAKIAKDNVEGIELRAGPGARETAELLTYYGNTGVPADTLPKMSEYERFVVDNHLHLSFGVEAHNFALVRWDNLALKRYVEPINAGGSKGWMPPPVFAMTNTIKQNFILARDMVFKSSTVLPADQGLYYDTLDYAKYGPGSAHLIEGFRLAASTLDQIAVAANETIGRPVSPNSVYFGNYWSSEKVSTLDGVTQNPFFVALSGCGADWGGGIYSRIRATRNSATHRFVVLHDNANVGESRDCNAIEHFSENEFRELALDALRLTRAAFMYMVGFVLLHGEGADDAASMFVPVHNTWDGVDNAGSHNLG